MSYSLALHKVPSSLRKTAREQLDGAAEGLQSPDDPVEAVHDARKRIKKSRALLRLARPSMRPDEFRVLNRALRDQGRTLSGARDADVLLETVDDLAARNTRRIRRAHFDAVRTRLANQAGGDAPHADLTPLAEGTRDWPVKKATPKTLVRALTRTYKEGRKAYETARHDPTSEHLHEWRKRVKDLWYQQRLLARSWPDVMKALAGEAKALSKLLGTDHDLAVLADELPAADPLRPLIADRRAELQHDAFALGARVYAESPKAFKKRVRSYVRAVA
jgi:CHAD domain-containing protein